MFSHYGKITHVFVHPEIVVLSRNKNGITYDLTNSSYRRLAHVIENVKTGPTSEKIFAVRPNPFDPGWVAERVK